MVSTLLLSTVILTISHAEAPADPADLSAYDAARATVGRSPEANIRLALWCETHGLQAEKLKHLALAVLADPKNATARGLMGMVAYGGQWKRPEAVAEKVKADEALTAKLAEYNGRRARTPEKADDHWALALWCEQNGLDAEARAHFTAVTRLDPSRDAAWKRLGCKKVDGRWASEAQIAARREEAEARKKADKHWKPLLTKWKGWLSEKARRDEAEDALAGVTDPHAVAAVWEVFGRHGAGHQLRAVQIFGQIDATASSRALAVLAAWGGSSEVRKAACETLCRRDPREYVGPLLSLLRRSIRYQTDLALGADGYLHRVLHVEGERFDTEIFYKKKVGAPGKPLGYPDLPARLYSDDVPFDPYGPQIKSTLFSPYGPQFGPTLFDPVSAEALRAMVAHPQDGARILAGHTTGRATTDPVHRPTVAPKAVDSFVANAMFSAKIRDQQIAAQLSRPPVESRNFVAAVQYLDGVNARTLQSNSAVYTALNLITRQDLPEDPEPWRKWYYDVQGYAYTRPQPVEKPKFKFTAYFTMPSCFAAGTMVRTIDGLRPIETMQVGDQVLAQDTRTGGLNFRAVTAVHHNPPGETLEVRIGDEVILPSIFHRFWRAGQGWAMARDLKPGDEVRTYGGRGRCVSVESSGVQPVFNLDVAEDHTFFVGRAAVLVHDNTLPELRLAPFDAAPALAAHAP